MKLSNLLLAIIAISIIAMSAIGCAAIGQRIDSMIEFPALKHLVGMPTDEEILITNNTPFIAEIYCFEKIVGALWPGETFRGKIKWNNPSQEVPITIAFSSSLDKYRANERIGFAAKDFQHKEGSQKSISWEVQTDNIVGSEGRKLVLGAYPPIEIPDNLPNLKYGKIAVVEWPDFLFEDKGVKFVRIINPTNYTAEIFYEQRQEKLLEPQTIWLLKIEHYYKKPQEHTVLAKLLDNQGHPILVRHNGVQTFKTTSRKGRIDSDLFWIKPPTI